MNSRNKRLNSDWDPLGKECQNQPLTVYDRMRCKCPVAYSDKLGWSIFRHEDVVRVLNDHTTFSSVVSNHPAVPNGFDPPCHTAYRRLIEPFFAPEKVRGLESGCREIANLILLGLKGRGELEFVSEVAEPYSVRAQCAFMGWKPNLSASLLQWLKRSQAATLIGDRELLAEVAAEFSDLVYALLDSTSCEDRGAVLSALQGQTLDGSPVGRDEIVSIVRNWTVGELGTLSAALATITHGLATNPNVQKRVRIRAELIPYAVEEFLRMDGPLLLNRRRVKKPVQLAGKALYPNDRITVLWPAANRDSGVFENPAEFRWNRCQKESLLYGKGIHVCPGATLARLELNVLVETLLQQTRWLSLDPSGVAERASFPAAGFSSLPLTIAW